MCVSVGFVVTLAVWSYWRVLRLPPPGQGEQL